MYPSWSSEPCLIHALGIFLTNRTDADVMRMIEDLLNGIRSFTFPFYPPSGWRPDS